MTQVHEVSNEQVNKNSQPDLYAIHDPLVKTERRADVVKMLDPVTLEDTPHRLC